MAAGDSVVEYLSGGGPLVQIIIMLHKDHLFPAFQIIEGLVERIELVNTVRGGEGGVIVGHCTKQQLSR